MGSWLQLVKHLRSAVTNNLLQWERRVRASSVPRRLNGFWNPSNPTQPLHEGKDWPIHCKDIASIWIWTREGGGREVTRARSLAGAWRCLISSTLSHSLGTNIFVPQFLFFWVQWQSPMLSKNASFWSMWLVSLCFDSCLGQNKGLPLLQDKWKIILLHSYKTQKTKKKSDAVRDNKKSASL